MKPFRIIYLVLILLLPFISYAESEGASLSGVVFDAETLQPLEYTNIYLDEMAIGAASLRNGSFKIENIPGGQYTVIASRIGYKPFSKKINFTGDAVKLTIPLTQKVLKSEAVTVTATLTEQTAHLSPAKITTVNRLELQNKTAVSFDEVLETVPGISVYRSSGASIQSLSIRGSSDVAGGGVGNRVLLLIDGRPALSADTGGALWGMVPIEAIDHVEVLKGAFSSLYGSSAMGGVVNVITRRPMYKCLTQVSFSSGIFQQPDAGLQYRDAPAMYYSTELTHSGIAGKLSYLFSASRKKSDGFSQNNSYDNYNFFSKMLYDLRNERYLELSLSYGHINNDYPHTWMNNLHPLLVLPKYRDDRQEKTNSSFDLKYQAKPNENITYSSRVYGYRLDAASFFNPNDPDLKIAGNQEYNLQTHVHATKIGWLSQAEAEWGDGHKSIAGMDWQGDFVASSPDSVMYGNHRVDNLAFFAQDEWKLSSKVTSTIGLRWDNNHLYNGPTRQEISANVAVLYSPLPSLDLRLLYGQGFRSPSIAERFFKKELNGGTLFKPNPDLRPEKIDFSIEGGLSWRWDSLLDVSLSYFRYHYKDMIYWVEISKEEQVVYTLFQVRNLNKAFMQGAEFTLQVHPIPALTLFAGYTYLDAKDLSDNRQDDYLAYRVKHSFNFFGDYRLHPFRLHLDGRYKSAVDEVFLYPLEAPKAFWVMNAKLSYKYSDSIALALSLKNIFNTAYEELARYRMPGRNLLFDINFTF